MIRLTIGALSAALMTTALPHVSTGTADAASNASNAMSGLPTMPVLAGPPWISIEHPVNPYDATTRDAFLLVHAFHHGTPQNFPVSGTAEGMVDGQRRTVNLEFARTSRSGVYALKRQWDTKGEWTLVVTASQGPDDKVSAVVELARGGNAVAAVAVPTRVQGIHRIPAAVSMSDVDGALRARASRVASQR
jgi:hypothetical protein